MNKFLNKASEVAMLLGELYRLEKLGTRARMLVVCVGGIRECVEEELLIPLVRFYEEKSVDAIAVVVPTNPQCPFADRTSLIGAREENEPKLVADTIMRVGAYEGNESYRSVFEHTFFLTDETATTVVELMRYGVQHSLPNATVVGMLTIGTKVP